MNGNINICLTTGQIKLLYPPRGKADSVLADDGFFKSEFVFQNRSNKPIIVGETKKSKKAAAKRGELNVVN